jgi:hypothetical protein
LVVIVKYQIIVIRLNDHGEGDIPALPYYLRDISVDVSGLISPMWPEWFITLSFPQARLQVYTFTLVIRCTMSCGSDEMGDCG